MIVRSRAPLRISFGGGGTDVPPYVDENGGAVLSVTLDKYTHCDLTTSNDGAATIRSLDYGVSVKFDGKSMPVNGNELMILTAALRRFDLNHGIEMLVRSDCPPGSGLGSSSAMAVAVVGAVWRILGRGIDRDEIARIAIQVERGDAGIPGGRQDHYAAAYGGLNFIEFRPDGADVQPLRMRTDLVEELQSCLVLYFTGLKRPSANIIREQAQGYIARKPEIVQALHRTKELAYRMRAALLHGDLPAFGELLNQAWANKRKFSDRVSNPQIDRIYEAALRAGASGGKLLGAGAGGHMLFLCTESTREVVEATLSRFGGTIVPFRFVNEGLRTRLLGKAGS